MTKEGAEAFKYNDICLKLISKNKLQAKLWWKKISEYNNIFYIFFLIILSIVTFITVNYRVNNKNKNKNKKNNYMKFIKNLIILLQAIIIIYIIYKIINNNILFNKLKKKDMEIIYKNFKDNDHYKMINDTKSVISIFNIISKIVSFIL